MKSPSSHEFADAVLAASVINDLLPVAQVAELIDSGAALSLAGSAAALRGLPRGNWIGGTTPYFMTTQGGVIVGDDRVFVTNLGVLGTVTVTSHGADDLDGISANAPDVGFALAILPAESDCHARFALDAPFYPQTFLKPTVGWIAGYHLPDGGPALVFDGRDGTAYGNRAVVAYVTFADGALAMPAIVNPFRPGQGEALAFARAGFVQRTVWIDGVEVGFADYCTAQGLDDGHLPLVADYGGAPINVAIKSVDRATGDVHLYAPVFPGVDYRFAEPVDDFVPALAAGIADGAQDAFWSCNCILNFLFGHLEGKAVGGVAGPVTFGEIAYQLLNQTFVSIRKA
jgi:hypothetical protein